jgi:uncharacterized protein YggE
MLRSVGTALSLVLGFSAISAGQGPSVPSPREPEITASGRGEVRLAPDYAYVTIGVTTSSPSAVETASQNAAKVAAVIAALRAIGLTEQQINTAGYNLTLDGSSPPLAAGCTAHRASRDVTGRCRTYERDAHTHTDCAERYQRQRDGVYAMGVCLGRGALSVWAG